jgi:signal transduction histidine kinase
VHKAVALLPRRWLTLAQATLLAAIYFGAARFALLLAIPPGYATALWPPSGIALAALLVLGPRLWPGVWLGSLLANLSIDASIPAASIIATGSTLQALVLSALIRRHVGIPYRFRNVQQVVKFFALSALGATVAPTIALIALAVLYPLPGADLFANWWTWWQGDTCGILIFTPLILSWSVRGTVQWTPRKGLEGIVLAALLLAATHVAFAGGIGRTFIIVPFIVWAAFRFGQREVTTAIAVVCAMALWYTLSSDVGPFAITPLNESLLLLLTFISTVVFGGLVLCAVIYELSHAMSELRKRHGELQSRVLERTQELEQANRLLQEAKVTAERASEAKSQFLANMSHELRTPLNSLLILARLLADNVGGNLNAKQVQSAQTIYASGMDLLALINDLLDLAKIESGAVTAVDIAPARLDELREDLERTFRQVAQGKGLHFSISIDPVLPPLIRTDMGRLKQVLTNLLANAFKFTRQGEVSLAVAPAQSGWTPGHGRLEAARSVIAFCVADTGIGIPTDKQRIIFEAFQQADGTTSRQYGGTGLGLSISRELTRLLGGEIRLSSDPGKGSSFTLYLPLADEPAA